MVKVQCSVISESWKFSKSLLVTLSKITMKLHNVQIQFSISDLKEIFPKTECMGSVLNCNNCKGQIILGHAFCSHVLSNVYI